MEENHITIKIIKPGTEVYCLYNDFIRKGKIDEIKIFDNNLIAYCIKFENLKKRCWKGEREVHLNENSIHKYLKENIR